MQPIRIVEVIYEPDDDCCMKKVVDGEECLGVSTKLAGLGFRISSGLVGGMHAQAFDRENGKCGVIFDKYGSRILKKTEVSRGRR